MKQIHHIVHSARFRMQLNLALRKGTRFVFGLSLAIFVIALIDRVGDVSFIPWNLVWIFSACILGIGCLVMWISSPVTSIEAACEVDQRLELHDRISTAMSCENSSNPFDDVVVEDAISITESKNIQSKIAAHFPITSPRSIWNVGLVAVVIAIMLWTPQWGWWSDASENGTNQRLATNENIESSIQAVLDQLEDDALLSQSLEDELSELKATSANDSLDSESLRREALRKITDVQKRLEELLKDDNALSYEEMLSRMQSLQLPQNPSMQPMVADMKNGDFDNAKKEFDKLQKQLESTELSEEERMQLAKAMKELADQLQKLSESTDSLASAMAAAGMNGNLASNPEAAMKAIQNAKNLTEEQKKQLLELLKSQQSASQMCKNMSEGCKKCASGKQGKGMASELSKLKAMQFFKKKAQMAKLACQNAAQGMCSVEGKGKGITGGKGQGNGGNNLTKETATTLTAQRSPVQTLEGAIIARQLFEGGLLTLDESTVEIRETVLAQQRDAEQAIIDEEVPRRYHDVLRHYFGQLEELTEPSNEDDTESNK